MKKLLVIICAFFSFCLVVYAEEDLAVGAKSAILMDYSGGEVLYEKNINEKLAPASMTKVMSMLLIMEAIDNGNLSLDDDVTISKEAADMGGSQVYLEEGEVYKVHELLKGIAIASGNDAVVAMAEKVAGSVSSFVDLMNEKARSLGLENTNFVNPHGLDVDNHYTTAYDMALIAKELLHHEKILEYTSIYEDYLKRNNGSETWMVNTNKLVRFYNGVDGLKTGFTENAKYCLTATALRNDLRLISVVMGEESSTSRSEDTVRLLNYGYNTFKNQIIFNKNMVVDKVLVEGGKKDYVEVVLLDDVTKLLKINEEKQNYSLSVLVDSIKAPVKVGDKVGNADIIDEDGNIVLSVPLSVKESVEKANFWDYFKRNLKVSVSGKLSI